MADHPGVVVTLDGQLHDPDAPLLYADDLAAVRGDGIFETLLIRGGRPCLLDAHLGRLAHSARQVDLPPPDAARWHAAVGIAVDSWLRTGGDEGVLRLVYSRGREHGSDPTAYATIGSVPARVADVRRNGLAALTLQRSLPAEGVDAMPWLLAGAKTLSYAVNMAALRHAERHGAGDVIFISTEGHILEGPRSTVVIATSSPDGRTCLLTPPPWYPILRGTTQQALFELARNKGYDCDYQALTPADLIAAQGVWLVSSITLAARVHTLDGNPLAAAPLSDEIAALVDAAILSDR
ncbi:MULTISPECIES: aminodeoxychorismate lyase [Mycolicibacterium]|jgi:4-amino-4-deoxychorismate lyase|uniref:Aminodeoxychorismate lyase n=1 Tax=Mycolicibacterium austroafricanum TaxID=39687 RepID=A0ABT8HBA6_MYCAO|nr:MULTISPECIES: aminodeoxychorismate lyase [Mycolicibacterium]MDN4518049.1 aminodeoxychorismate lyase [Mycolicibacterium austroafricanum]MDW5612119.1 aminodeoxychorismate lyase [Mycolicibacterium sp. D5.8-2]PQP43264.1 aminodeoxychorismate lyase [Mycolicibacterium austroafricanum]QRZ06191.1 aminodeoxychorismate lyase [Mycolicibacterium austroafricanum]QZT56280.1 aminodeoxychorismate lyase [Mycolicibacterium austroafricanum]